MAQNETVRPLLLQYTSYTSQSCYSTLTLSSEQMRLYFAQLHREHAWIPCPDSMPGHSVNQSHVTVERESTQDRDNKIPGEILAAA